MSDLTTTFTNIANAIRSKTGSSDTMTPSEMPDEIAGIETPMDSINITQNGTYEPSEGRGYNQVIVEVPEPTLITKSITANGTYTASADNADGYSSVTVAVDGYKKKSIANTPTDIASFNDGTANPMPSLEISIEPQQDLHGYDYPWAGGAGKNKFDVDLPHEEVSGSATYSYTVTVKANTDYTMSCNVPQGSPASLYFNGTTTNTNGVWNGTSRTFTSDENGKLVAYVRFNTSQGGIDLYTAVKNGTYYIQLEEGSTASPFTPYSNICPISGHTEANVTVTDDLTTPTTTRTISIPFHDNSDNPITVYGGTLNVTSGELVVTMANIASYNGETINEPWISSMDAYSAGVTPTTGAQVVYPLATPQTYQLTPAQVTTLLGQNNIFADCGQILQGEYFVTL